MEKSFDQLIMNYKQGRTSRRELISCLSTVIIKIPACMKCYDEDIKNEFYVFILNKLEKLIGAYTVYDNCKFITWFMVVLKRNFIQFYQRHKPEQSLYIADIQRLEYNDQEYYPQSGDSYKPELDLQWLSATERKIISLKYGFRVETIQPNEILRKIEKKLAMEVRISGNFSRLLRIRNEIRQCNDPAKKHELQKKEEKLIQHKRKNETQYYKINLSPSNRWIGEQLHIAEGTVASYMSRIKNKVKNQIRKGGQFSCPPR